MADLTANRSSFRGLIVPWHDLTWDDDQASVTQAGPRPGGAVPAAGTTSALALVPSGTMAAADSVSVRVLRPGSAGRTDSSCHLLWQRPGDPLWYGWQPPHVIHAWEAVDVVLPASTLQRADPSVLTLDSEGTVLLAYGVRNTALGTTSVRCKVRDPSTGTWGSEVTIATGPTPTASLWLGAALCLLPSGRILAHYWNENPTTGLVQVQMSYSDDAGATWTGGSRAVLPAALTYEADGLTATGYSYMGRIATAYSEVGQSVLIVVHLRDADLTVGTTGMRDILVQYASATLGATCTQIVAQVPEDGLGGGWPSVVPAHGGGFVLAFVNGDRVAGSYEVSVYVLDSAWRSFTATTEYTITAGYAAGRAVANSTIDASGTGSYLGSGDCTMTVDPGGRLWLTHRCPSGSETTEDEQWVTALSTDGGLSWEYLGRSESRPEAGPWWEGWDEDTYPVGGSACWSQGRLLVAHQWAADPGDEDSSIAVAYLGGWTSVTTPPLATGTSSYQIAERAHYEHTWIPLDLPSDMAPSTGIGWSVSGAGTATLTGGALNLSTSGASVYYTTSSAPTGTVEEGIEVVCALSTVTSTHLSTAVYLRVQVADGTEEYTALVRIGESAIRIIDVHGGSGAGTTVGTITVDVTAGVRLRVAIQGDTLVTYYATSGTLAPLEWIAGPTGTLTDAASYTTAAAGSKIQWGHGVSTAESDWTEVHWSSDSRTGTGTASMTLPADLASHAASGPVFLDGGLHVEVMDGPGYVGDEWTISTRYDRGVERIDGVSWPSPRHSWRSLGSDPTVQVAQQVLAWRATSTITTASRHPGSTVALSVHNATWRTGSIRRRATGGSWSTVATIDAASGMSSMAFARAGATVYGDPGIATPVYYHEGELRGASIDLGSNVVRRIRTNTAGYFGGSAGRRCTVYLEEDGLTDTEPTSGDCAIWPSDFAVVTEIGTDGWRGLQVIIDAQYTATGYVESGTIIPGHFLPFSHENSWGRVLEHQSGTERYEAADRTDRVRHLAPVRRLVELAWVDGVDLTTVSGVNGSSPDTVDLSTTVTAQVGGVVQETPLVLEDLVRDLDGGRIPCAYVPHLTRGSSGADTRVINRRERGPILCRYAESVRREVIQGDEDVSEVVRISTIALVEIV